MKKIILVILIFILLAGAALAGYFYFLRKKTPIEQILRKDILTYVYIENPAGDLQKFMAAPVWKSLTELDYNLLLKNKILTPKQHYFVDWVKNELPRLASDPSLKKLLGRGIAVGLYAPKELKFDSAPEPESGYLALPWLEEILSNVVVIGRIEPEFQLAELLSGFSNKFFQYVATESIKYKKYTIHLVGLRNTNFKLGFTRIKDLLVVGLGDKMARRCIDIFERAEPALGTDIEFKKLSKNYLSPSSLSFYLNIEQTGEVMKQYFDESNADSSEKTQINTGNFLKSAAGFTKMGGSIRWDKISAVRFDLFFDLEKMEPALKNFYASCAPRENKTTRFVPQDVLMYQWGSCVDLNYYWEEIENEIKKKETIPSEVLGFSVKEILSLFGDEMGGYLADIETGGLIPLPRLLVFAKINDQNKIEEVFKKLFDRLGMTPQEELYSKVSIQYLTFPLGESVQPGYCFLDEYLLLGVNREVLKQAIDAFEGKSLSIAAQEELKDKTSLDKEKTGFIFVQLDKTLQRIEGIIEWLENTASLEEKKTEAFKAGSLKRLEDVRSQLTQKTEEQKLTQERLESLEKNGPLNQEEINKLKMEAATQEKEIQLAKEREKELKEFVEGYEDYQSSYQRREIYINEIILPLLRSFESFFSLQGITIQDKEKVESIFYLKLNEK